jgi:hypothetical protein
MVRPSGILATPRMETFPRQRRARRNVGRRGGESGSHSVVNTKGIKEKTSGRSCAVQWQNLSVRVHKLLIVRERKQSSR